MQDVKAAIDELERSVTRLGLKGAELDTNVNGSQWDEQKFLPFFKAAEAMGAVLFFHPQPQNNFLAQRIPRYGLFEQPRRPAGRRDRHGGPDQRRRTGGVPQPARLHRARRRAGVLRHGAARPQLARASGDAQRPAAAERVPTPPLLRHRASSEEALRFLIDRVGIDRVVLGSDWPFVPWNPGPGGWVQSLKSLTQDEKDKILWKNLELLLKL